jgi:hypothetical protein
MDDFRIGAFLVVVICIFFACFHVVVYIPTVILIRRGRTIIPTRHRVSHSSDRLFSTTAIQNHEHEPWGLQAGVWVKKTRRSDKGTIDDCRIRKRTPFLNTRQGVVLPRRCKVKKSYEIPELPHGHYEPYTTPSYMSCTISDPRLSTTHPQRINRSTFFCVLFLPCTQDAILGQEVGERETPNRFGRVDKEGVAIAWLYLGASFICLPRLQQSRQFFSIRRCASDWHKDHSNRRTNFVRVV